jgi:outer membrane usher protein
VAELSAYYGLNNSLTVYGGAIASNDYHSLAVGNTFSTPIGGVSADVTVSQSTLNNEMASSGSSLRLIYSTLFEATNTNITVSSYRYSTKGFWSFNDMVQTENYREGDGHDLFGSFFSFSDRQKSRFDVNLNQSLSPGWGSLYLSGEARQYWNRPGSDTLYRLNYSNMFKSMSYSLGVDRSITQQGRQDNQIELSMSVPLFSSDNGSRHYLSARSWQDSSGNGQVQASLSGNAGERQQYDYNVSTNHSLAGGTNADSYSVSGGYQGSLASVTGGMTTGQNFRQTNLGISGGVVAHSGGVTFGQTLGETVALVEAENAGGAQITNNLGALVNSDGFGLVPSLSPYSRNRVELDSTGLPVDVQLDSSSGETIPTAHQTNGAPLPFGLEVLDSKSTPVGYVGQGGNIFVRGIQDKGALTVHLDSATKCVIDYSLPAPEKAEKSASAIRRTVGVCQSAL